MCWGRHTGGAATPVLLLMVEGVMLKAVDDGYELDEMMGAMCRREMYASNECMRQMTIHKH
jgi:hypothetical protein